MTPRPLGDEARATPAPARALPAADLAALSRLVDEALAQAPTAREAWIDALEGERAALAPALRRALARMEDPLANPAIGTLPRLDAPPCAAAAAGELVGPWRLERPLGRGGMGEVWLATRADGAFDRQVALKLPRAELLSDTLRGRFARERDILAAFSHPHIAQFLDAGLGAEGRPYIAMERVDGPDIVAWCDARSLGIEARLALALQVLDALAHAHERLVAHRDLKPSNILVTVDGGAKLLDFGIAKLLDDDDGDAGASTELTRAGGRVLTPDYAAPEQIAGEPVTTAVDLYAFGIVLYEMLAGRHPFAGSPRPASSEAPLASVRACDAGRAAGLPARTRRRALRGDLDAVLAHALEPDPSRRYRSAAAFAADLRRVMNHEPVEARRIGWATRAGKFVRRHRAETALAAALGLSVAAGVGAIAWEAGRARVEARHAESAAAIAQAESRHAAAEARRQRATRDFLVGVFKASDPRIGSEQPRGAITARALLDLGARRIDGRFADDPDTRIELLGLVADIYGELDENDRFEQLLQRQTELAIERHGEAHAVTIDCLLRTADGAITRGDYAKAGSLLARIDGLIARAGLDDSPARAYWLLLRSWTLMPDPKARAEREKALADSLALYERVAPDDPRHAFVLGALGSIAHAAGDDARSVVLTRRSIAVAERAAERDDGALAVNYSNLGKTLAYVGDFEGAESAHAHAVQLAESTYGRDAWPYWIAAAYRAQAAHLGGDRERADAMFQALMKLLPPPRHVFRNALEENAAARARETYATRLAAEGRPADALPLFEAARIGFEHAPTYEYDLRQLRAETGAAADAAGRRSSALRLLQGALDEYDAKAPPADPGRLRARESLARALWHQGAAVAAGREWRRVIDDAAGRPLAPVVLACEGLARAALRAGDAEAAQAWTTRAEDALAHVSGPQDARLGPRVALVAADVLLARGQPREASARARQAVVALRRFDAATSAELAEALATEARAAAAQRG
jgi:serine/threonine-protein kinase